MNCDSRECMTLRHIRATRNTSWDVPLEELPIAMPDLQYWLENIDLCNGKTWPKQSSMCTMLETTAAVAHLCVQGSWAWT